MFYNLDEKTYHEFFKKVKKDLEDESIKTFKNLLRNLDSHLDLNLSKEAKEDLIIALNDDFWIYLKNKINMKRNNKGPGNLTGIARATGKNEIVLNEIIKNDDNITITNNKGCVNIGNGNSNITNICTSTTVIKKSKKNY